MSSDDLSERVGFDPAVSQNKEVLEAELWRRVGSLYDSRDISSIGTALDYAKVAHRDQVRGDGDQVVPREALHGEAHVGDDHGNLKRAQYRAGEATEPRVRRRSAPRDPEDDDRRTSHRRYRVRAAAPDMPA